jgi:chemotaxis protein CheC
MVNEQVHLSEPSIKRVSRLEAMALTVQRDSSTLVAVHQVFEGDITGRGPLIFPQAKSLELVRAVIGGDASLEEIIELEQEALAETGNIILNGCIATIANLLERSPKMSLPEILYGERPELIELTPAPEGGEMVICLPVDFLIRQRNISGYLVMLMDMSLLTALQLLLQDFIMRTTGDPPPSPDRRS